jgi:tRNA(fMet)-specific endonuclease VapC
MYLLDTNFCIDVINGRSPLAASRLQSHDADAIRLCSVVKAELRYGARLSSRVADNLRLLEHFFAPYISIPFDDGCTEYYGQIRADLQRAGTKIGPNDLMIAAIAKRHDLTLVTHNTREFSRVVGLRVEDWKEQTL